MYRILFSLGIEKFLVTPWSGVPILKCRKFKIKVY